MQQSTLNTVFTWAIPVLVFLFATAFMYLALWQRKRFYKKQKEQEGAELQKQVAEPEKAVKGAKTFFTDDDQPVDDLVNAVNDIKPHDFSNVEDEEYK